MRLGYFGKSGVGLLLGMALGCGLERSALALAPLPPPSPVARPHHSPHSRKSAKSAAHTKKKAHSKSAGRHAGPKRAGTAAKKNTAKKSEMKKGGAKKSASPIKAAKKMPPAQALPKTPSVLPPVPVAAVKTPPKETGTGLPLPRYARLRAGKVYMRRGPGTQYPIDWVYYRRGLPVKIEREFGLWRLVETSDGQKGWMHQVTLGGGRDFVLLGEESSGQGLGGGFGDSSAASSGAPGKKISIPIGGDSRIVGTFPLDKVELPEGTVPLRATPDHEGALKALLRPGAVGKLLHCPSGSAWCQVSVRGYEGWMERRRLWGLDPGEAIPSS